MKLLKFFFKKNQKESLEKELKNIPYTNIPNKYREDLAILFASKFTKNKGKFFFCENLTDLKNNFELVLTNEKIKLLHCFDDSLYDLLSNFDVEFTTDLNDQSNATFLKADYIEAKTGKIYISKSRYDSFHLTSLSDSAIVIAYEDQLIEKFINLYNDFYSLQNLNKYTSFSIYKKEIFLFLIEKDRVRVNNFI